MINIGATKKESDVIFIHSFIHSQSISTEKIISLFYLTKVVKEE